MFGLCAFGTLTSCDGWRIVYPSCTSWAEPGRTLNDEPQNGNRFARADVSVTFGIIPTAVSGLPHSPNRHGPIGAPAEGCRLQRRANPERVTMKGKHRRRIFVAILVWILFGICEHALQADEVDLQSGLSYQGVKVVGLVGSDLAFRLGNGRTLRKSVADIKRIAVNGLPKFNAAEEAAANGRLDDASAKYKECVGESDEPWYEDLVQLRAAGLLPRTKGPGSDSRISPGPLTPATGKRCLVCRGTNLMACMDCQGTGRDKCAECGGRGRLDCPSCNGKYQTKCTTCAGRGSYTERRYVLGAPRLVSVECTTCNGKGYSDVCSTCKDESPRGKVRCPICKGVGRSGDCPTCRGTKNVPCKICGQAKSEPAAGPANTPAPAAATKPAGPKWLGGVSTTRPADSPAKSGGVSKTAKSSQ